MNTIFNGYTIDNAKIEVFASNQNANVFMAGFLKATVVFRTTADQAFLLLDEASVSTYEEMRNKYSFE